MIIKTWRLWVWAWIRISLISPFLNNWALVFLELLLIQFVVSWVLLNLSIIWWTTWCSLLLVLTMVRWPRSRASPLSKFLSFFFNFNKWFLINLLFFSKSDFQRSTHNFVAIVIQTFPRSFLTIHSHECKALTFSSHSFQWYFNA